MSKLDCAEKKKSSNLGSIRSSRLGWAVEKKEEKQTNKDKNK